MSSCSNTRLWAEKGSPGGCFPTPGHLQKQLTVWKREESPPPKHQETASPCTLLSHPEVFQEPAEFPSCPPYRGRIAQKGLQESHDCSISASPSSTPCSPLLPTLHRGLTTARENQQGSSQQAPTCAPDLGGHSCRGLSPALHPLSALAGTETKLPFPKERKKPPRLFRGRPQPCGSAAGEGSDTRPPPSSVTPAPGRPHPAASARTALQHSPGSKAALQIRDLSSFLSGKPGCCPRIPPSSAACNPWVGSL